MKLPPECVVGACREGRTDSFTCAAGVEPLWLKGTLKKAGRLAKRLGKAAGKLAWNNKCLTCYGLSNPVAQFACYEWCRRI